MDKPKSIVVCVTRQFSCEHLIVEGASYARENGLALTVVHVVGLNDNFFENTTDGEALDALFTIAKQHGGVIQLVKSDDVFSSIVKCAHDSNAVMLLVGKSPVQGRSSLYWRLGQALPGVDVIESKARQ